jgi:hypothetical protein
MQLRRPIAALVTALALFGGGTATLTACGDPAGTDRNDGTTDDTEKSSGSGKSDLPDNSDPDSGNEEDKNNDSTDPQ